MSSRRAASALFRDATLCALLSFSAACKKQDRKPAHTEPWLLHPPASATATGDAALPAARYALGEQSRIRFELASRHGTLHGTLTRVSGELSVNLSDLASSRGQVRVDLSSLTLSKDGSSDDSALSARAKSALGASAGAAPRFETDAGVPAMASFTLSSFADVAPALLEAAPERDGGTAFTRKARATAIGDLLLHGFRVVRRAPLEVEFTFTADRNVPAALVIRSRAPFVISLETHQIAAQDPRPRRHSGAALRDREARVSVELYGIKIE